MIATKTATGVYISTGAFRTHSVEEILPIAARSGIQQLELSSGAVCPEPVLSQVQAAVAKGLRVMIHNYFPRPEKPFVLNLASDNADTLAVSLSHCRRAIDLSVRFGSRLFTVHSGFLVDAAPDQLGHDLKGARRLDRRTAQARFVESLKHICAYAEEQSVRIAIENNVLAPFNMVGQKNELLLGVTAQELLETLDTVAASNLGILVDFAHAKVSARTLGFDADDFVTSLDQHIFAFHVSENDGSADQNWPVDETSWSLPHIRRRPEIPVVLESYKLEDAAIARCQRLLEQTQKGEPS